MFWKTKSNLWHTFCTWKIPSTKVALKITIYKPPRSIMNNYYKNIYEIDLKNRLFLYELELFSNKTLILNPFLTKYHNYNIPAIMLEKDGSLVLCWTLFWWVTFTAAVVVVTTTESDMFSLFFVDFFNSELLSSTITKESILLLLDSCRSRLDLELESSSSSSSSSCWPQTPIKNKKRLVRFK